MQQNLPLPTPPQDVSAPRAPFWLKLASAVLRPWIRIRREPREPRELLPNDGIPTVYVVERYGLSDTLILEQACREAELPSPYESATKLPIKRTRAIIALTPRPSLFRSRSHSSRSETLSQLAEMVSKNQQEDIRLVPVSIFVGRAPDRQSGWFRVLFAENWVVVGRFRRLLAILLNGRDTIVQFSAPVSLKETLSEQDDVPLERSVRKLSRVLRVHFRLTRTTIIGADLSHKRTVVDSVVDSDAVRQSIDTVATKEGARVEQVRRRARSYALEIAADYSHTVVRSISFILIALWNKLYDGVVMHHFDKLRAVAPGHEVIYVPCHRSHVDYLLLSYTLYQNGLVPPHIAAGVNLNLPGLGALLRRGGAFFLRRSFKSNALYSAVFTEYVSQLFARGVALEYFIEGGRSRTGRLLQPRSGMLAMTLRSFLRESRRPVLFQPVYFGYEKLMEGNSYIGELSGKPKEKESLLGLFRAFGVLRQRYGKVAINFGEPINLGVLLDEVAPNWRDSIEKPDSKPEWLSGAVDVLAERIQSNINRAVDVNPINLLALALLAMPKHAMAEADLLAQLELYKDLLIALPYSDRVTVTEKTPAEIIAYGEAMQWIRRVNHPLGDVLMAEGDNAVLLSYFRNNVQHVFVADAWIACCFLNNQRMSRASVLRLGKLIYPFIQAEWFLPWSEDEFSDRLRASIDFLVARGLLESDTEGRVIERAPGQSDNAFRLRALSHSLLQAVERYYITLALLTSNGRNSLTAAELEKLCTLTAQRLSLLNELNAPEFFDKSLFRGFILKLRERRVVRADADNKLDFDADLEALVKEAKVILSRDIRHGILKLTSELPGTNGENDAGKTEDNA
ncbi:MAG TPA: glycerol-3-phosphate 1-O-acyltransferase PlsB [Dokdonella sp.]|nr:glycerol-3-phosphate 1-O-acyltransferase PlsB [Dokdonella sp.]HET9033019.1 glycerol-3-phosphate 1-O-acyltransferase PlsB [Dokdonella sp.]